MNQTDSLADKKIGFIGAGNMAQSLIGGLLARGVRASQMIASDPSSDCRKNAEEAGIESTGDNLEVVSTCNIVLLAVKPQVMRTVLEPLKEPLQHIPQGTRPLLISIAAGVSCDMISEWLGGSVAIVRCMPNTPALLQLGATGLYGNNLVSDEQRQSAEALLSAVGVALWLDTEDKIDAVTALSGSGPAYFFYVLESMIEKAVAMGIDQQVATILAQQTALGAARMAAESDVDIAELRKRVTSPNGTTEAALNSFKSSGLSECIATGMQKAADRAAELEKELS